MKKIVVFLPSLPLVLGFRLKLTDFPSRRLSLMTDQPMQRPRSPVNTEQSSTALNTTMV